jgi:photosynthetic reaction center cytochrome c subunit
MNPPIKALSAVLVVASLIGALAAARAQTCSLKLAEERYKNIKVLKGIPADQVIPAMQFMTASLGVECEYCHVRDSHNMVFDKDDKKSKVTARKMMEMMVAINKENFDGNREVTCYSCHRGAANPVATPIITDETPKPETAEKKSAEAQSAPVSGEPYLDKYLAAVGGADAVQKITSRIQKGRIDASAGQHFSIDVYSKAPDKRISVVHMPDGDSVTAFDGHSGWLSFSGRPVHFMTAEENGGARIDADLHLPVHLRTLYQKFVAGPGEEIDGHDATLVEGRTEGQPPLRLYFDTQSGLLLRLIRYVETPLGRLPTQVDYSDYRDAEGVKLPFRWTVSRPGSRFTILVDQLQQNISVDDAKFTPPPTPPPDQKPAAH